MKPSHSHWLRVAICPSSRRPSLNGVDLLPRLAAIDYADRRRKIAPASAYGENAVLAIIDFHGAGGEMASNDAPFINEGDIPSARARFASSEIVKPVV